MSYKFSEKSKAKLETCHVDIQKVMNEVIKIMDITILEGERSEERQLMLYNAGRSKLKKGGKHVIKPSLAVDICPYPAVSPTSKEYKNYLTTFYYMSGIVMGVSKMLGVKLRWGGDWDADNDLFNQSFIDLAHFELV